ncbi:AP2-like ethylene-responsive transcription factor PLT2 [Quercus suber]|uniref:AP2-like ethylene-responsive transcription factor PLT2 n=1 Tax=Quercus suber TaxID=58331 RepID=UPI0032DF5035
MTNFRKSRGFAKGTSIFRGVSRNSDNKKWQAKLGKGKGVKGLYIGTFDTEEEAAKAYDVASIRLKGMRAVTNFDLSNYNVKDISESARLPIGKGASKLIKKTPVEDVLLKKANTRNTPRYYLQFGSSSSSQPNSVKKPFELLQSLTARKNHLVEFPQNYNTTNQVLHQSPSSSYLNATHGLPRIGREDGTHENLSLGYNFELPINGVSDGHLAWMDTNKHINQVQFQSSNFPPNVYQNPNYQNSNFPHESMNVESGLESDGFISGYLNGEFPMTEVFDGNAMLTKNVDSAIGYKGFQQMESLQNFNFIKTEMLPTNAKSKLNLFPSWWNPKP